MSDPHITRRVCRYLNPDTTQRARESVYLGTASVLSPTQGPGSITHNVITGHIDYVEEAQKATSSSSRARFVGSTLVR